MGNIVLVRMFYIMWHGIEERIIIFSIANQLKAILFVKANIFEVNISSYKESEKSIVGNLDI